MEAGFRRWGRFASWPWTAQLALGLLMVGGLVVLGFHARPPTATKHATTRQARPQDPAGNPLDVVDLLRVAVAGHDCDALWRLLSTDTQAGADRRADGVRSPLTGKELLCREQSRVRPRPLVPLSKLVVRRDGRDLLIGRPGDGVIAGELLRLTPERGQWRLAPSPGAAEQTAEVYLAPEIQLRDAYKAEWLAYRRDQAFTPDAAKLGGLQFATGVADSRSPANEIHITVGAGGQGVCLSAADGQGRVTMVKSVATEGDGRPLRATTCNLG